eukprot:648410-Pelagomonas_calceolata.AAC.4
MQGAQGLRDSVDVVKAQGFGIHIAPDEIGASACPRDCFGTAGNSVPAAPARRRETSFMKCTTHNLYLRVLIKRNVGKLH